jgi:hypothetical protein
MNPGRGNSSSQFKFESPGSESSELHPAAWATARRGHRGIRPMVYMLKGKVSSLRLIAITWTASSDAARPLRQACKWGEAAARHWGNLNAQALAELRLDALKNLCISASATCRRLTSEAAGALGVGPGGPCHTSLLLIHGPVRTRRPFNFLSKKEF